MSFGDILNDQIDMHIYYDTDKEILTMVEAEDEEPAIRVVLLETDDQEFGVTYHYGYANDDKLLEVELFETKEEAQNRYQKVIEDHKHLDNRVIIVWDDSEKREILENLIEQDLFEKLGLSFSVSAKSSQNDDYDYQVYTEDGSILLIDKLCNQVEELKTALKLVEELKIISLKKKRKSFGFERYLEIENTDGHEICITLNSFMQNTLDRNYLAIFKDRIIKEFSELNE